MKSDMDDQSGEHTALQQPAVMHRTKRQRCLAMVKSNLLLILLLSGMALGIILGVCMREVRPKFTRDQIRYFRLPGDLLLRMLKMLILPLIVSSLVTGLAALDAKSSGKMGLRAVVYYMATTLIAVIIGIILVVSIRPGKLDVSGTNQTVVSKPSEISAADTAIDLIFKMFPDNLIEATFRQTKTYYDPIYEELENGTKILVEKRSRVGKQEGMNILGILVFTIALGIVLSKLGERGRTIVQFFDGLNEATMILVNMVIWYSPVGVMFLIAAKLIEMDDIGETVRQVGMYTLTVLTGLFIHGFIVLPLLYFLLVRKNPFRFIYGVLQAIITAFGTASSSATLPVTFRCLEEINGVDKRVTRFVLPIGATINMDGTALYEAVAAIFIGQINGYDLNIGQVITTSLTATLTSIGAAGIPQASLVMIPIVLTAVNLPADDIAIILTVDWLLDRFRTAINVLGDSIGAGVVAKLSEAELRAADLEHAKEIDSKGPPGYSHVNDVEATGAGENAMTPL
ncbi:unnamed protein product [Owenia fusiformis]|uniref:Amino acid transporter n=1 Tax=Owenia fusiformis TaxID=6347 RepID=A0A8J1US32_OWEFU|nr:unnamed protein product [Owenia fusiformis]